MKKATKYQDFFENAEKILPKKSIEKSKKKASEKIFKIKLSELRKKQGFIQTDINSFSQSSLSRLESRKDVKISTLIDYIHCLDMELEIKVKPRKKNQRATILYKG